MRYLRHLLLVVVFLALSAPVSAVDCSVSCPVDAKIGDLDWASGCLLVGAEDDPLSWCNVIYDNDGDADNVGTCPSECRPIYWGVGRCERMSKPDTEFPYATIYYCERRPLAEEVPCCTYSAPAACRGACGTCQSGLACTGGACADPACPSDADCVCDAGLRLMASWVPPYN